MATNPSTSNLTKLLAQREAEIAFLKNTVKLECEERMGLVSIVSNLQKEKLQIHSEPSLPNKNDSERTPKNSSDDKRAEGISDKEKALYAMYHTAMINREKKLARQRRN